MTNELEEIRENAIKKAKEFRKRIRNSKYGLLKILALDSIPVVQGAILSEAGRMIGGQWEIVIPVAPLAMDAVTNLEGYSTLRGIRNLALYGVGIALPHADKIYQPIMSLFYNV